MWYNKFTFFDKQDGLGELPESGFFSKCLTEEEIRLYPNMQILDNGKFSIPLEFALTTELRELLEYSNGGGIVNGKREFGYFSLQHIRYYYFSYGFPKYAPYFLPIAFNGGGVFYAYDFRDLLDIKIVAVSAGDLGYESSVVIGKSLEEVLSKTTCIEEELDKLYQRPETKIRLLFVCTINRMRSATAHKIYENDERFHVKSAGTDKTADTVLTNELLNWADSIIVMEKHHRNYIRGHFPDIYKTKKIVCLYIPDEYDYMQTELIEIKG